MGNNDEEQVVATKIFDMVWKKIGDKTQEEFKKIENEFHKMAAYINNQEQKFLTMFKTQDQMMRQLEQRIKALEDGKDKTE